MKRVFLLFITAIILFTYNVSASEYSVSTEEELINALNSQVDANKISLNNDIKISGPLAITGEVLINGNGHTLSYGDNYTGKIFDVSGFLELTNLNFNGNNNWSWINTENKYNTEIIGDSTTLNIGDTVINSSAFEVTGILKISGSTIYDYYFSGCNTDTNSFIKATGVDSKVIIDSTVVDNLFGTYIYMANGKVEFNNNSKVINSYGVGNKGALFKINGGELTINNSILKDNCGLARSGSLIGAVNNALVTFNSGLIDNNIAKYYSSSSTGSMITLETGAGFVMNGGTISNNVGTLSSVLSTRLTNSPDDRGIFLNGGVIKNNTTTKATWLNSSIFMRSALVVGKDMVIDGDVVINNTNASLENNGTINGKVTLNDSTATAVNNGLIKNVDLLNGEFVNNTVINNAYELNTQITNNGNITDSYVKELTIEENQILVEFDINNGKEKDTGYTVVDKVYDLNYKFTEEDIIEVEREGYNFLGWYIDSEFNQKLSSEIELTENMVIYAKWEKIPEVDVPDTYLGIDKIVAMFGVILILFGSIVICLMMSKQEREQ